jgi:hypothetical protein
MVELRPMKRLPQRLATQITLASTLLCILTAISWTLSYFRAAELEHDSPAGSAWVLGCERGEMFISHASQTPTFALANPGWSLNFYAPHSTLQSFWKKIGPLARFDFSFLGFVFVRTVPVPGYPVADIRTFYWPCWFLFTLSAIPPVLWYRNRTRFGPGHCPRCGYDLRATPDRCPECGAPVIPTSPQGV